MIKRSKSTLLNLVVAATLLCLFASCEETIRANNSLAGTGFEGVQKLAETCTPGDFQETGVFDGIYEVKFSGKPSWHDNPRDDNIVANNLKAREESLVEGIEISHVNEELTVILTLENDHELEGQIYVGEENATFCFYGPLTDINIEDEAARGFVFGNGSFAKDQQSITVNLQIGVELEDVSESLGFKPRTTLYVNLTGKK
jgi:hypothetical protein